MAGSKPTRRVKERLAYLDQVQKVVTVWGRGERDWEASIVTRGRLEVPGTELALDLDRLYAAAVG